MERFISLGGLGDIADDTKPQDKRVKHGKNSDILREERERYFGKSSQYMQRSVDEIKSTTPSAEHFSKSAELFRNKYIISHKRDLDIKMLIAFICNLYEIQVDDLMSKSRKLPLPILRKYISFFAYYYFQLTMVQIGKILGKDHSTIVTHIADAIDMIEAYERERVICHKIDKFIHQISNRRKHNAL
jgi:chromosomal replication initiation ATPase DnaA